MPAAIQSKPKYSIHRKNITVIDSTDLDVLFAAHEEDVFSSHVFGSIHGVVNMASGTVTLQPLEHVKWLDNDGASQQAFYKRGSTIGPLSDRDSFEFLCDGGGKFFLQVTAQTGNVDEILLAGGKRGGD